mgnify:CR=1 FL=1
MPASFAWQAAREKACGLEAVEREPQLACLDGVLARLDAVVRGVAALANKPHVDVGFFRADLPVVIAS